MKKQFKKVMIFDKNTISQYVYTGCIFKIPVKM